MALIYTGSILFLVLAYSFGLLYLRKGLSRLQRGKNKTQPSVSIIIAAKDEQEQIERCLRAILNQHYPKNKLEVLVIDDRSSDRTPKIVFQLARRHPQLQLLRIRQKASELAPKKMAIEHGIRRAKGEIIVTTDADCRPGPNWISELMTHFEADVGIVVGYNPYRSPESHETVFSRLLALDYFSMAAVAAASAGLNYPISCSGGNLAYRKSAYLQVGGFRRFGKWVSGDDDFFLQHVRQNTEWEIRYAASPAAFVPTIPPQDLTEFRNQRIRYASKCAHYARPVTVALIGIYFLNLFLVAGPLALPFLPEIAFVWPTAILIKALSEGFFLKKSQDVFADRHGLRTFLLATLLHPVYIVTVGVLGQFSPFEWKREKYWRQVKVKEKPISQRLIKIARAR